MRYAQTLFDLGLVPLHKFLELTDRIRNQAGVAKLLETYSGPPVSPINQDRDRHQRHQERKAHYQLRMESTKEWYQPQIDLPLESLPIHL